MYTERATLLAAFVAVLLLGATKVAEFDIFFHLRLGADFLAQGSFLLQDTHSYTFGQPYPARGWLADVLLYGVHALGGFKALGLLKLLLLLLLSALVLKRTFLREAGLLEASALVLLMVLALRMRLHLRPQWATYLGAALFAWMLQRPRQGAPWGLLPAQVLWAQCHGGFVLGPLLAALYALGESIKALLSRRPRGRSPVGLWALALTLFALSGLNPDGFSPYRWLLGMLPDGGGGGGLQIAEWQGMSPQHLWGFGLRYTWAWQVLVLLGGLHILRSAFRRSLEPFELLLFLGAVVFPLRYVRFVAVSAVLLAPLGVWALQGLVRPVRLRTVLCGLLLLSMPLMLWQWGLKSPVYAFGLGLKEGVFPARAVQFLKQRQAEGRLFNTIPAGSYLLWAWPQKKVFIDGRLLQAPRLQQAYEQALREPEAFRRLQEQWGFKFVLSEYNHRSPWRFPLHLSTNPRWALVYFGPAGVVWAIRSPENEALIRRFGYRRLVPSFYDFSYLEHYLREGPQLLQDLRHDVALEPLNQEAHLALAYAAYYLGQKALALEATLKALELAPETAFEHNAAAVLYLELGQRALARRHARRALRLQPQSRQAREILRALR